MAIGSITVDIRYRPFWIRILRFPFVWRRHFLVFRRDRTGIFWSLYGAWYLAGISLHMPKKNGSTTKA